MTSKSQFFIENMKQQKRFNELKIKMLKRETENIVNLASSILSSKNRKYTSTETNHKILKFNKKLVLKPLEKKNTPERYENVLGLSKKNENMRTSSIGPILTSNKTRLDVDKMPPSNTKQIEAFSKIENALNELNAKQLNKQRCGDRIYHVKLTSTSTENIDQMKRSRFFSKKHIFDVYLDDENLSLNQKKSLPPIINDYNETNKLKLIQKFNPTTVNSFKNLKSIHMNSLNKLSVKNDYKTYLLGTNNVK